MRHSTSSGRDDVELLTLRPSADAGAYTVATIQATIVHQGRSHRQRVRRVVRHRHGFNSGADLSHCLY